MMGGIEGAVLDGWYFHDGAGMLRTWRTREVCFTVRSDLVGGHCGAPR